VTRYVSSLASCALLAWLVLMLLTPGVVLAQQADARMFPQTGYRIADNDFWTYFQRRGGVRTFGYPVSNPFTLQGFKVQIFQRAVLQMQPNGTVGMANVLDDGMLPYTTINGSNFPGIDPDVTGRQPTVGEAGYHEKALQFVKENAPDTFQGQPVNFFKTFSGAVKMEEAFPDGGGSAGLLQGFDLEIWGLPTSKPTVDPNNHDFIYQRFQRGIMHYDAGCKCTQGLLLADYLKSILTLHNLPQDLAQQASKSPFYGQVDPSKQGWLKRPGDLPASDLTDSFLGEVATLASASQSTAAISVPSPPSSIMPTPTATATPSKGSGGKPTRPTTSPTPAASPAPAGTPTATSTPPSTAQLPAPSVTPGKGLVFVDPGHGGKEIGASTTLDDGTKLIEKDLNLKVAGKLIALLKDAGIGVATSRTTDAQVDTTRDLNNDTKINLTDDLQARVDGANAVKADILVSVHFNGIDDPTKKGTQTFYSEGRPFSGKSQDLATLVQASLLRNIGAAGYQSADRGATTDSRILGQGSHYYLLGPESPTIRRPSEMPGVIGEPLFVTSPDDAGALRQEKVLDAVARGYFEGIKAYFDKYPPK
jgi:N-acetylmuramoyl-L-alanine amidase